MRPRRLEMEGFGAFRQRTVVDFTDLELVALVGRTGSGKSTIIDAITFALFGCVARYDDKKVVAPVINQTSTRARVQLDFELGDGAYTAVRLVQRRGAGATTKEARLEHDGNVLAGDARTMTAEVERRLGLDADQFNRTVVLPQGRFADFLHDSPAERQRTLRSLLGLGIYQEIASEARRRSALARSTADALRTDLDADVGRLTEERRAELVARRDAVIQGRARFVALVDELTVVEVEATALDERLRTLDAELELLDGVRPPDGLAALEDRRTSAAAALATATGAVGDARRRRQQADAAVAAGPDLVALAAQRAAHEAARAASAEHERAAADLAAAEARAATARTTANAVLERQAELDGRCREAIAAEAAVRAELGEAGSPAQLDHWLALRHRRDELVTDVGALVAAVERAGETIAERRVAADAAAAADADGARHHGEARDRAGAAGLASLLRIGEPCPLCQQVVGDLPSHDLGDELVHAAAHARAAAEAAAAAQRDLYAQQREHAQVDARLTAERRALATLDADLQGVPARAELETARATVDRLQQALQDATATARDADAAAREHRDRPAYRVALSAAEEAEHDVVARRALEAAQAARRDRAQGALTGLPDPAEVERAVAEATRLAAEQRDAVTALTAVEDALERAMAEQRATEAAIDTATTAARATRDRVAALGPPAPTGDGPRAVWDVLVAWATDERERRRSDRATCAGDARVAHDRITRLAGDARDVAAGLVGSSGGTREQVRERLAQAETTAHAEISAFDEARAKLDGLRARVADQDERRLVADQLALHLRADRFEAWLMEAAVGGLVEAASARLHELTAGAFSLVLVDTTFMVRDHANADELRSARTLSGGETFLASLALALALADATSELAPEGSAALESIFLDEGFGSLDPDTLDVVAAAIEELGSAGRMVVVVTHVRELADRLPVRLEVVKDATTATVERVDA